MCPDELSYLITATKKSKDVLDAPLMVSVVVRRKGTDSAWKNRPKNNSTDPPVLTSGGGRGGKLGK